MLARRGAARLPSATETVMSGYLVIFAIGAVVLLAVWRWDERTRRAELDRRRRFRAHAGEQPT
jgi:hypothetical protein